MALFDPAHPGELIRETIDGLREANGQKLTIAEVAEGLGTSRKTLSSLLNGHQSISPEMAVRLGVAFPNTTAEFWLRVQENFDLARVKPKVDTSQIRVFEQADFSVAKSG